MIQLHRLSGLAALLSLLSGAPAAAQVSDQIVNTATARFQTAAGPITVASNTVVINRESITKRPTFLAFHLLPPGYDVSGATCDTSGVHPSPIPQSIVDSTPTTNNLDPKVDLALVLTDPGDNLDPTKAEVININISLQIPGQAAQLGVVPLTETGPNTGVFTGGLPAVGDGADGSGCVTSLPRNTVIALSYTGSEYSFGSSSSALVDPIGVVFDSSTGSLISGATVSLVDGSGAPAQVFGDDGVSAYPSTLVSGTSVKDASGRTYSFNPGEYRFPKVASGSYRLVVTPPAAYTAPSQRSTSELAALRSPAGYVFTINAASFLQPFTVSNADFYADIPLDPHGDTQLVLTKSASVREASPGDFITYTVAVNNRGGAAAQNVHLTDILPVGLRYERGSSRGVTEPTVSGDGRRLDFLVATVPAGGTTNVRYTVTVAPGAPNGEALNRVLASGSGGATSNEAAAAVRIRPLLFTDGITIIGRVSEGDCNDPAAGRKGVAGVRIMLEDGTYVVTDRDGLYHFEGVRPGRHVVQLDVARLPASHAPIACDRDTRSGGSAISRFVESDGGMLDRVDFQLRPTGKAAAVDDLPVKAASDADAAGDRDWLASLKDPGPTLLFPGPDYNPRAPVTRVVVSHTPAQRVALSINGQLTDPLRFDGTDSNADKTMAVSRWSGIGLVEGDNRIEAKVLEGDGQMVATLTRVVHVSAAPARAVFVPTASRLVADGLTKPLIAVQVTDAAGRPVRAGTLVPFKVDAPYRPATDRELDQRRTGLGAAGAAVTARVVGDQGLAFIVLDPTTAAGEVHAELRLVDEKVTRVSDVRAWLSASTKDWVVVGFGAGTLGYKVLHARSAALPRGLDDGIVTDGQLSFYAKGRIKGQWLLTMAYDSDKVRDRDRGLLGQIDPDKYYTVYGDGTQQGYDAASAGKLYLRLERRTAFALFGDYQTGLSETQLTRYSRTLNGVQAAFHGRHVAASAFAARTDQLYGHDEIQGNGLSGPYRLSARSIVPNSDKVRIETRDRLRPELVIDSTQMTRNVDYDIDADSAVIRFKQPVLGRDGGLNPIFIVVDYETDGTSREMVAGGRVTAQLGHVVQVGATVLHDATEAKGATVLGFDVKARPSRTTELRGEYAAGGRSGLGTGRAWLAEIEHHDKVLDLTAYARQVDPTYGLGQQSAFDLGARKFGFDSRLKINDRLSLTTSAWRSEGLAGQGTTTAADIRLEWKRQSGLLFLGTQLADDNGVGTVGGTTSDGRSRLITVGGSQTALDNKLTLSGQLQVAPGGDRSSTSFPTRQQLGLAYRLTDSVRLLAGYEVASSNDYTANTARVGFDITPWKGGRLTSTMNTQRTGENGDRAFANYGLIQSLSLGKHWSLDATLDASSTLSGHAPGDTAIAAFASALPTSNGNLVTNGADYVATTFGAAYRGSQWSWNGRAEYRWSSKDTRLGLTTNLLRTLGAGKTLAAGFKFDRLVDETGAVAAATRGDIALAWRPLDSRWSVLERFQLRNANGDAGVGTASMPGDASFLGNYDDAGFATTFRLINNIAINYRSGAEGLQHGMDVSVYYGSKWVKGTIGTDDYAGYVDVTGVELRHDLGRRFDLGVTGSVQHAWDRHSWSLSYGPSVGVSPAGNMWISAGYNVEGYRDRDFSDERYTRAGPYVTVRLKVDQTSIAGLFGHRR